MALLKHDPFFEVFETLEGQRIAREQVCRILGIPAPMAERELITWLQYDEPRGTGINAQLATYTPEDGEPFDASLAVYEQLRNDAGTGAESHHVATLEFVIAEDDSGAWIVQNADVPGEWQEESIGYALAQLAYILNGWPMEREAR